MNQYRECQHASCKRKLLPECDPPRQGSGFARRLYLLRKERNLSRRVLGELCGLSGQSILRYESDERYPDLRTLRTLARCRGLSVDCLIEEEEGDF